MHTRGKLALALFVLALSPLASPPAHGVEAYHEAIAKGHELGWSCYESSRHSERWSMECHAFLAFAEHGIGWEITEFKEGLRQAGVGFLLAQNDARMQESALKAEDMSYLLRYAKALRTRHVSAWEEALPSPWLHGSIVH